MKQVRSRRVETCVHCDQFIYRYASAGEARSPWRHNKTESVSCDPETFDQRKARPATSAERKLRDQVLDAIHAELTERA